jgi:hypothetical protein
VSGMSLLLHRPCTMPFAAVTELRGLLGSSAPGAWAKVGARTGGFDRGPPSHYPAHRSPSPGCGRET